MRNLCKLLTIGAVALGLCGIPAALRADDAKPATEQVVDKEHHFQISVPSGWTSAAPDSAGQVLKRQGERGDNMNLIVSAAPGDPALDDVTAAAKAQYPNALKEWKLLEETKTTFGGKPARRLIMTGSIQGITIKLYQVFTISKGQLFIYSAGSVDNRFDGLRPKIDAMVESFKILED